MTYKSLFNFINLIAVLCLLCGVSGIANAYDFSSGVFEFQQKLAKKGNPQSQYKLGNMYENGQGVKANLDEAAKWYKKSAAQNNAPAKMRLTYIDIKKNGYNKAKHGSWLKKLQKDAAAKDGESLFLLATMHKKGFIVKKDLNKSAKLFKSASIRNIPGAEAELEAVNTLLYRQQNKQQKASAARAEQAKKDQIKKDKAKKDKQQAQERKKAADQRKKQQAAQQRSRASEQERKAREKAKETAAEKQRIEKARQEEQQRQALAAEQAKAKKAAADKKKKEERIEVDPLVDKSKCKGKKARFLTMCR